MDESYRDILPYLRPRTGEVSWMVWLALGALLFLVLGNLAAALLIRRRRIRQMWHRFDTVAAERGLAEPERRLLRTIAHQDRMRDPLLLLSSLKSFDRHVGGRAAGEAREAGPRAQGLLAEVSRARKQLGFDRVRRGQRVLTTRQLQPGLTLMVWPEKGGPDGFVTCAVVARDDRAIAAVPLLKADDRFLAPLEVGERLKVRFWDQDEIEYRFRTEILDAIPETTTIFLRHAESLERVQPYDFFRLHVAFDLRYCVIPRDAAEALSPEQARSETRARPVQANVFYVSGEGLGIFTKGEIPPDHLVIIDPDFEGAFPLGGLACDVEAARDEGHRRRLNLRFINLPPGRQKTIVARMHRHQTRMAHPR